ncbi:MAG: UDP-N-acetylmuramoyl-L-alanine--D-glutamate ligase, partial [Planctomycetota bacterium]
CDALLDLVEAERVELRLGDDGPEHLDGQDLLVVNPAVKPGHPLIARAVREHLPSTTEIELLIERLPKRERVIGVTGSAGKSTTTAMIAHLLRAADPGSRAFAGGNLGGSMLADLDSITPRDWVVLELSSFMLERMRENGFGWSPHAAVVTTFAPNHIDWHGSLDAYRTAKQELLRHQDEDTDDFAVLGPGLREDFSSAAGRVIDARTSPWLAGETPEHPSLPPLAVPGAHNRQNAQLACAVVGELLQQDPAELWHHLADFSGLPHRLQLVAEHHGVRFYNDSKSTTPEAALLAIDALTEASGPSSAGGLHLILGGYDKGVDLSALARHAAARCAGVYAIGATAPTILEACGAERDRAAAMVLAEQVATAVREAKSRAQPGDAVCLSPGCASWDQFTNYQARGEAFEAAVAESG